MNNSQIHMFAKLLVDGQFNCRDINNLTYILDDATKNLVFATMIKYLIEERNKKC